MQVKKNKLIKGVLDNEHVISKKTKFRKQFKGRIHGNSKGNYSLNYGSFGLKAMEPERVTSRQIEAARKAITRYLKRAGRMWIRIFPDVPVSKNLLKLEWVKEKDQLNIGHVELNQEELCLKLMVLM